MNNSHATNRFLVACAAAYALTASPLAAQDFAKLSLSGRAGDKPAEPGYQYVPWGYNDKDQWVIPRYADGANPPAGGYWGRGIGYVLRGTKNTQNLAVPAVVATEDFGKPMAQWQGMSPAQIESGMAQAVSSPVLRDLSIVGFDPGDNYEKPNVVNNGKWKPAESNPWLFDGLAWQATAGLIANVNFFHIPGRAAILKRTGSNRHGQAKLWDNGKPQVRNIKASRCFAGFEINMVDGQFGPIGVYDVRDFGVKVTGGANQFDGGVHVWGVNGAKGESPAVWFAKSAGGCWGGPWYPETSEIGMLIESYRNRLWGIYSHTCWFGNIRLLGAANVLRDLDIEVTNNVTENNGQPGILIANQFNTLRDGRVSVAQGETGVSITGSGGNGLVLDNIGFIGAAKTGATGRFIEVKSPLNSATIRVHFGWLSEGVGLDFYTAGRDRIGTGNTIHVTYDTSSMTIGSAVKLHPDWTTTPDDSDVNDVRINGVRYYREGRR